MQQACPEADPPADLAAAAAAVTVPDESIAAQMQHSSEPVDQSEEARCKADYAQLEGLGDGRDGAAAQAVGSSSDDSASMAVQLYTDVLAREVSIGGLILIQPKLTHCRHCAYSWDGFLPFSRRLYTPA